MSASTPTPEIRISRGLDFRTTHWSIVLAARADEAAGQHALSQLCQIYWYPLYAFVRRRGYDTDDAQDLTQEFLTRLIERRSLNFVDPEKGRFRSFLLASLKNFLVNEWTRSQRQKRGGGRALISLDEQHPEARYQTEPVDTLTPERIYDRTWAATLLEHVLSQLERECADNGKADLFEELKPLLCGEKASATYSDIAARHGISEGAVKMTVLRLRQRYAALLRAQIAHTVETPGEIEEEIRHLLAITAGS
jgi:RNA polymerase sigma factor (sigma-70 family)